METKKKNWSKVIALAAVIVIVLSAATIGIMAAAGVFRSDKKEAFKLLAQVPDKLNRSYTGDYVGMAELAKQCAEKGSSASVTLSKLKLDKALAEEMPISDLDAYTLQIDSRSDVQNQKASALIGLSKGDDRISVVTYTDKDKVCLALPELCEGKFLSIASGEQNGSSDSALGQNKDIMDYANSKGYQKFSTDLREFLEDEVAEVQGGMDCETTGEQSYRLTIPKDSLNKVMEDFYTFMSGQEATVKFINFYMNLLGSQAGQLSGADEDEGVGMGDDWNWNEALEESPDGGGSADEGMSIADYARDFDLLAVLKETFDTWSKSTSDFSFDVVGDNGSLRQIATNFTVNECPVSFQMNFGGTEENSEVSFVAEVTDHDEKAKMEIVKKNVKADTYKDSTEFHLDGGSDILDSKLDLSLAETVDPKENTYLMEITADIGGGKFEIGAKGQIKNLNPGKSVSYALDEIAAAVNGETLCSMAMDVSMGVFEGDVEPPTGQEIVVSNQGLTGSGDVMNYYIEALSNGASILAKWGLLDMGDLAGLMGGNGPTSYSSIS